MSVRGLESLRRTLQERADAIRRGSPDEVRVEVGYDIYYAIYVHWNLEAHHPNGKAMFLMEPYLSLVPRAAKIVALKMSRGLSMKRAIIEMAEELKEESQKLVPIKTGALRDSAFVRVDGEKT